MSGTKEKATGKQSAKSRAGKVSAPEVAQADASDLPGAERSVTLPGHYVAVGASPVSLKPGDAGAPPSSDDVITLTGDNVSISAPAIHISAEHLNSVQRELQTNLTPEGLPPVAEVRTLSPRPLQPTML